MNKIGTLSGIFRNKLAIPFFVIASAITLQNPLEAVSYVWITPTTGNWHDAANWTPGGGPPITGDNATINIAAAVTVDSNDAAATLDVSGPVGDIININSSGTLTIGTTVALGTGAGTQGTININTATAHMVIGAGGGLNVGVAGTGVLNINNGATLTNGSSTLIGSSSGGVGSITVDGAGSTFNALFIEVGAQTGANGTLTIQNGGLVTDLALLAIGASTGTLNLFNGVGGSGVLNTSSVTAGVTGNSFLNFNGGTIQANANNTNFISGITAGQARIFNGGAIFDTQTFNITVSQNFADAPANSGSITKAGTGTLILNGTNTLSGTTTISAGTLQANVAALPTGVITNNAALIFDQGTNATFASSITGSGSLTKINLFGTLTLTGLNSYTGLTTITEGILEVNSSSLPAAGGVNDNATLLFTQAADGTYAGNITGSGVLFKQAGGNLILTGTNSYTGGTTVTGGTLTGNTVSIPSSGGIFDASSVIFDQAFTGTYSGNITGGGAITKQNIGTLILTGTNSYGSTTILAGTLQGDTNSISSVGPVLDNGSLVFDQGFNDTFSASISGSGSLTKQNIGTLILGAPNSYTGGTSILGGVLQGNTSSIPSGPVLDNASLVFDQGFDDTFSGSISGSGSLTKQNTGTLILSGINSYAAGTFINAGTLQGDTNSIPNGAVVDNANLIFNQNFDGTFAGSISGAGSFMKAGSAKLQLTGNSGAFAGTTTVTTGNLNVNAILGGTTTTNIGAILSGIGTLGNVFNNGTIKPGNSIGTIHVANFVNGPTGIYQAEINGAGASTQIAASGTAMLNGGEIVVTADPGIYLAGTTYTLISTGGGIRQELLQQLYSPQM